MDYGVHGILQAGILEWVAFPFSRGSSQPRIEPRSPALQADSWPAEPQGKPKNIGVSKPVPSQMDLPHPGIKPGSTALQVDSLPTELSGKPISPKKIHKWSISMKRHSTSLIIREIKSKPQWDITSHLLGWPLTTYKTENKHLTRMWRNWNFVYYW